jgi:molybdate transport system substrate-binding protein
MKLPKLLALMIAGVFSIPAAADTIRIAVASNFAAAMQDIAAAFETETGHKVMPTFGASGKFYAQIHNGAPFQVFLSADDAKPLALENESLGVPKTRFTYAIGTLVLWSSKSDFVDQQAQILKHGDFNKLAIANPELAPYGAAALEVLHNLGVAQSVSAKIVQGENIAQTYQFVETGNAELGFVALSQIVDKGKIKTGSAWIVPANLHKPLRQDAVLLKAGANSEAARAFLEFLRGALAKSIIDSYGYQTE